MFRLLEIIPNVYVATSSLYLTNSIVIEGANRHVLVIDPGVTVQDIAMLTWDLRLAGFRVNGGFSTHPHWDHVLWSQGLGDVPRYATQAALQYVAAHRDVMVAEMMPVAPGHDLDLFGRLTTLEPMNDGLFWDGPSARIITHGAHAPGHAALFFPDFGVLISGDMLSDVEIPLLDLMASDPIKDYRAALRLLSTVQPDVHILIPGHGHVGYGGKEFQRRMTADMTYLNNLEKGQISPDPRLRTPWLQAEHTTQWQHFHRPNRAK